MQPELTTADTFTPLTPLTYARRAEPAELAELMDAPCDYQEYRSFLRDLSEVNCVTRSYKLTLAFLDRVTARITAHPQTVISTEAKRSGETPVFGMDHHELNPISSRPLRILDVGCGGGDTLRTIARWAAARNLAVELTGIDLNPHSTRAAREFSAKDPLAANIQFITADIFTYAPNFEPDIVLSALFTHHLTTPEVIRFLAWMEQHARLGWFVNDLHRSRRAAFLFRFLPILFGWHEFIQYDGPVSLRRAFIAEDWLTMFGQAHITEATIKSHPMNRLCVSRIR
jgi:2-polyprenyl-3-methyl-5-hydroxy-6-metoxy-1,4-benzoquinol methylase